MTRSYSVRHQQRRGTRTRVLACCLGYSCVCALFSTMNPMSHSPCSLQPRRSAISSAPSGRDLYRTRHGGIRASSVGATSKGAMDRNVGPTGLIVFSRVAFYKYCAPTERRILSSCRAKTGTTIRGIVVPRTATTTSPPTATPTMGFGWCVVCRRPKHHPARRDWLATRLERPAGPFSSKKPVLQTNL